MPTLYRSPKQRPHKHKGIDPRSFTMPAPKLRGFALMKARGETAKFLDASRRGGVTAQRNATDPSNPHRAHRYDSQSGRAANQTRQAKGQTKAHGRPQHHPGLSSRTPKPTPTPKPKPTAQPVEQADSTPERLTA